MQVPVQDDRDHRVTHTTRRSRPHRPTCVEKSSGTKCALPTMMPYCWTNAPINIAHDMDDDFWRRGSRGQNKDANALCRSGSQVEKSYVVFWRKIASPTFSSGRSIER